MNMLLIIVHDFKAFSNGTLHEKRILNASQTKHKVISRTTNPLFPLNETETTFGGISTNEIFSDDSTNI